jgi:alcohol dehydrogenase
MLTSGIFQTKATMKSLIYAGPNQIAVQERPIPAIASPTDAIVKMLHTTICGSDLHILKGDVPTAEKGRVLGHEGVGMIAALGSAVEEFYENDIVLISCITACSICPACRRGLKSHCTSGGWLLGNIIDGTQAEYVQIPHASSSLYKIPGNVDSCSSVALSDSFPTALECGTLNANVQPGNTVAIVGAGPVGLAVMLTAKLYSPSLIVVIDKDETRLKHAKELGADSTINPDDPGAMATLDTLTNKNGFDSVIEAVGLPDTFEVCQRLVAAGGAIANVGVHGKKAELYLDKLWDRNISEFDGLYDKTLDIYMRGDLT